MAKRDWLLNLCVPELRVADVSINTSTILKLFIEIKSSFQQKQLCLFPQLALSGSTCADLFFQPLLAQACLFALENIENAIAGSQLSVVLGLPLVLENQLYDAAVLIELDGVRSFALNQQPDPRYFQTPNPTTPSALCWKGRSVAIIGTSQIDLPALGVEKAHIVVGKLPQGRHFTEDSLILNPTALPALADSTYETEFHQFSSQNPGVLAVCSAGASESTAEGVFSGLCQVWQNGKLFAEDSDLSFESKVLQTEAQTLTNEIELPEAPLRDSRQPYLYANDQARQLEVAFDIQVTGLVGRFRHTKSETLLLGISGGADSSMALLVCCQALDQMGISRENLIAVSMPGPGSSDNSINNTAELTKLLGIKHRVISIETALSEHLANIGHDGHTPDVTFENAQARERTQILMDLANMQNGLVVGTGDLSEIALGWSTYNGDQMCNYNVNAGLPKTVLQRLLVWAAEMLAGAEGKRVAQKIVDAPISPELQPLGLDGRLNQATEEVLGPYLLHDFYLWHAIKERKAPIAVFEEATQVFAGEFEPTFILQTLQTFYQRFFRYQFKRTAAPDGPQIFSLSLSAGSGWRMPSDASPALWLKQLDDLEKTLHTEEDNL